MTTSDVLTLIGLVSTGVITICGVIAWFHIYMANAKEKYREELAAAIQAEAEARRLEIERVENQVKALTDLTMSVALMGKSIEHLTEKFSDHQTSLAEVKKALLGIDGKVNQLAIDSAKRIRTPRQSASRKKATAHAHSE